MLPFIFLASSLLVIREPASPPPQISWEWFNAAEIYRQERPQKARDLAIAAHYYRMAADKGNTAAAYRLADAYEHGTGVKQNDQEALRWYRFAAERGDKYALLRTGWFYEKGLGTDTNLAVAAIYYEAAAERGNEWGYSMLAFLLADGRGVPQDVTRAQHYFEISIPKTQDPWAEWKLATIIADKNPQASQALLRKAAAAGNEKAIEALSQGTVARVPPVAQQ